MKRVLFGVTVATTARAFLIPQLRMMTASGWDVHLACARDGSTAFEELSTLGFITLHEIRMRRGPSPFHDGFALIAWSKLVRELAPNLVVGSTPKAALLSMIASRRWSVPLRVYHVRGFRAEGLDGLMAHISRGSERIALQCSTHAVFDSKSLLAAMNRARVVGRSQGVVLGEGSCCGVDTNYYRLPTPLERESARRSLGLPTDAFVVGFVGRLTKDKGLPELIQAVRLVRRTTPAVHLAVIGPVDPTEPLTELMDASRSEPWISLRGAHRDPREAYWAFDVFALPSHREGFPISVLEAQSCGLPAIVSNATGCIDAVSPERTGIVIPINTPDRLATAILELASNSSIREEFAMAGRERAITLFEAEVVNERMVAYLDEIFQPKLP